MTYAEIVQRDLGAAFAQLVQDRAYLVIGVGGHLSHLQDEMVSVNASQFQNRVEPVDESVGGDLTRGEIEEHPRARRTRPQEAQGLQHHPPSDLVE